MKLGKLRISPNELIDRNMAVIGATDSGKSYAVKKLVRDTKLQVVVLDINGEYQHPKRRVTPENENEARHLGAWLAEKHQSICVDFQAVPPPKVPGLAAGVLSGLYHNRRSRTKPCLIVVDEAYFYAPEAGVPGSASPAGVEACEAILFTIQARGRHRGLGTIIITQRPQYTRKHVLAQCQYTLVFRLNTPPELRWIRETGYDKEIVMQIAQLPTGTCYAFGFNGPMRVEVPA